MTGIDDMLFKSFYDPHPKSGIKTMTQMQKAVRIQSNSITLRSEVMYLRLINIKLISLKPLTPPPDIKMTYLIYNP